MEILHAIVLGIVQGLSEFLPISSSGHLELTRWLFGWDALDEDLETAFDVAVHLGTLVGAIAYLRRDVGMYVTAGFGPLRGRPLGTEGKIAWFLVASAVPAGIAGVALKDQIADFDRIWMIAVMLIVFGLLLLVADRLPERKELEAFRLRDALAMGVGQALALQPGVSRSGATLTVSRFLGYERDAAARLVFLMSLPIIAGAGSMTSILSLRAEYASINIGIGIILNMIFVYLTLRMTDRIERFLGRGGIAILKKVFGIILLAIAVKLFSSNASALFITPRG